MVERSRDAKIATYLHLPMSLNHIVARDLSLLVNKPKPWPQTTEPEHCLEARKTLKIFADWERIG